MMLARRQSARPLAALVVIMLAQGCGESGTNPPPPNTTPTSLTIVSGNNQTGDAGTALGSPLVVRVANSAGDPLSGVTVNWTVSAGGGSLNGSTSTTNAQGQASQSYTLGTAGQNTVRAAITGTTLTADFSATANAAPITDFVPATIEIASGNNQSATVSSALPSQLVVRVRNAAGQALPNISVDWAVASGGGVLTNSNTTTNTQGLASVSYTVGSAAGPNSVTAEVTTNTALTVTFAATATAVAMQADVSVNNNFFNPMNQNVAAGGSVTWTWVAGAVDHNVTWVAGGFTNSPTQNMGTHVVAFANTGTFDYYCTIHGTPNSGMRGSVVVQ